MHRRRISNIDEFDLHDEVQPSIMRSVNVSDFSSIRRSRSMVSSFSIDLTGKPTVRGTSPLDKSLRYTASAHATSTVCGV